MVKIDTLFQTKKDLKKYPFGAVHTYTACIRATPRGEKLVADYESHCLRKRD